MKVESGEKEVEIAKTVNPNLITMDIMIPGTVDGLEATRVLKNDPETKSCQIIMLTSKGQQKDQKKGFKAGADDYFVNPFSPLGLIKKVEEVLGQGSDGNIKGGYFKMKVGRRLFYY